MVFISYSWHDKIYANSLVRFLKSNDILYWIDEVRMNLEEPLEEQIIDGLKKADYYIKIQSSNSKNSEWVSFEEYQASKFIESHKRLNINKESLCITQCDHAIAYRLQQIH